MTPQPRRQRSQARLRLPAALAILALAGCSGAPDRDREIAPTPVEPPPGEWLLHGRTFNEQRHSPLNDIHDGSVGALGLAWSYDTGESARVELQRYS